MLKINLWYIISSDPREWDLLNLSLKQMTSYDWVNRIIVLDTNRDHDFDNATFFRMGKIEYYFKNFGSGWEKSIEDGGFNEIAARNYALSKAENEADWVLNCDADEFFDYSFGDQIWMAHEQGYNEIFSNTVPFDSPGKAINLPHPDRHVRAWKTGLGVKYIENPNREFVLKHVNHSMHCVTAPSSHQKIVDGFVHIHTHDMWPWKRREYTETYQVDYPMPEHYITAYEKAWEKK